MEPDGWEPPSKLPQARSSTSLFCSLVQDEWRGVQVVDHLEVPFLVPPRGQLLAPRLELVPPHRVVGQLENGARVCG